MEKIHITHFNFQKFLQNSDLKLEYTQTIYTCIYNSEYNYNHQHIYKSKTAPTTTAKTISTSMCAYTPGYEYAGEYICVCI